MFVFWIISHLFVVGCVCRGRACWILKRRSSSRGRNTRSPPHPHGACTRTQRTQSSHLKRLWWPRPSTHWSIASTCTPTHTRTRAHTHSQTHTRTHTQHIWDISSVLAGPVGGWGVFLFFPILFPSSFYLLFVSCKPRDIGENRGGTIWVLYQHCPAGGASSSLHFIRRCWRWWSARISWVSPEKPRQLPANDARIKPEAQNQPRLTIAHLWMGGVLPQISNEKNTK